MIFIAIIIGIYAIAAARLRFTRTFELTGQRARAYGLTLLVLAIPAMWTLNNVLLRLGRVTILSNHSVVLSLNFAFFALLILGVAVPFRYLHASVAEEQTTSGHMQSFPQSVAAPSDYFGWTSALSFSAAAGSIAAIVSALLLGIGVALSRPLPAWLGLLCIYLPVANVPLTLVVSAIKSRRAVIAIGATVFSIPFLYMQTLLFMAVAAAFGLHAAAGP
jgi:hypothetical protein